MLKKLIPSIVAAALLPLAASATPASVRLYHETVSQVDQQGSYFRYAANLLSGKEHSAQMLQMAQGDRQLEQILKFLFSLADPGTVKAQAESSVKRAEKVYVFKHFSRLQQQNTPNIWSVPGSNSAIGWDALPADTIIATSFRLAPGEFLRHADNLLHQNPANADLAAKLDELKRSGVNLIQLLSAVDGEIFLLVKGSTRDDFGIKLVIPDKGDRLAAQLKSLLPPDAKMCAPIPVTPPKTLPGFKPVLHYGREQLVFVSSPAMLNTLPGKLSSRLPLRQYLQYLPANGNGYSLIDLAPAKRKLLSDIILPLLDEIDRPVVEALFKTIPDFQAAGVTYKRETGFGSVTASSISLPDSMILMPFKLLSLVTGLISERVKCYHEK